MLAAQMPIVIQDHLAGELADFVAIDDSGPIPEVRLVHCKASGGAKPAARLGDVQELAAQAIRSVQWLAAGPTLWGELRRRLDERDATKVVEGDRSVVEALLDTWSTTPPLPTWSIWLVQPGVSDAVLDDADRVSSLLTAAHAWVSSQSVDFALICSP